MMNSSLETLALYERRIFVMIMMQHHEKRVEVIVVGTGIGGLAAAKTYLELAPQTNLLLLEERAALGGVWADNCYEGLHTNNLYGSYEFADFPLDQTKYNVKENTHVPAHALRQYFSDFADHFDIRRRIRFSTRVHRVEKIDGGWKVKTEGVDDPGRSIVYTCDKLIISTGISSRPNDVSIPGQGVFGRPVMNHSRLGTEGTSLAHDPRVKSVTVIGASKYGHDVVYMMASQGKHVDWVIRKSGGGAVWMGTAWVPFGCWRAKREALTTTRFVTWFSPCIWGSFDGFGWLRRLLHGTRLGRWLVHLFWEKMSADVVEANGYRKEEPLKHLEPDESFFWTARVGILTYPTDIYDFVRSGQVRVLRKDISHLSEGGQVHFSDGESLQTDALVQITGWKLGSSIKYEPEGMDASLGIPSSNLSPGERCLWKELDSAAESEILNQFPYLRQQPAAKAPYQPGLSPFRLYRGIAPPGLTAQGDNSLAFMKMVHSPSNPIIAEIQALWVYAYLNNKVSIARQTVFHDTALLSRYGKLRYPCGFSSWYPEIVFDSIPYVDMLLTDLGLRKWRKATWTREVFEGYTVRDYQGINQEWARAQKGVRLQSN
ncbi:dimethylaniline monooxygenase [Aspergillus heteromorphus CBS 117.55]|uniref:Dimethylaniline monooxygenase n=1 Tax=Aspergillus heteromorphus CBS 117.55 TaxID=1448321 RepID=A0A317WXU4_9EURO|nr:dimethylaniline monooxygenase [Aspergillus heteromorphus CBS 117.55]PWY90077.1 dimethylaniline monooxygenase [Aspergillus heteromorphus CBS 117.55]